MKLLRDFKNLTKNDVALAGGKGASLGEMTKVGIPVPFGFVVLSSAFEKFLEETDLNFEIDAILDSVNHKEVHTVEGASEKIKALILQAKIPQDIVVEIQKFSKNLNSKYVAVRSSATAEDSASAAWAGQLESYLNITEDNLLENVKKCWASLFTARAIFYRFENDLHKQKISVAVVVQKMVESEKSGTAFSVHPVTQDRNQLIIEAGLGLGEAIVSGQITPDSYVVKKQPRRIIDKNIQIQSRGLYRAKNGGNEWHDIPKGRGEKQVLSDKEILELSEIILQIENHYGFPCDIEWAFEKRKFYITQSRPITTLGALSIKKDDFKIDFLHNLDFIYEAKGRFSLLFMDIIARNFTAGVDFMSAVQADTLVFYVDSDSLEKKFFKRFSPCFGDEKEFRLFLDRFDFFQRELEISFSSAQNDINNSELILKFLNSLENFIKNYNLIDVSLSSESEKKLRKQGEIIYKNYLKIGMLRNTSREFINSFIFSRENNFEKIIKGSAKFLGVNDNDILFYNVSEMKQLFSGIKLSDDDIIKRKEAFVITRSDNKICYYYGKDVFVEIEEFKKAQQSFSDDLNLIKGNTAFSNSKVIGGLVSVFPDLDFDKIHSQIKNMSRKISGKDNVVFVTKIATPEMSPLLIKAKAIITDLGGLNSHAAIVAREFKIPCIVGTKIATKILKDGDTVEINTDKGLIKILKKST